MTESEAIKICNTIGFAISFSNPKGTPLNTTKEEISKAMKMAIQALEKQIPKKVQLRHIRKFDGFDDGECPTCGNSVSRDCDGTDNFCPDCGQKLDWRGE